MSSDRELVVHIVLDWRVLAVLVVLVALAVAVVSTAGAQSPPTANGEVLGVQSAEGPSAGAPGPSSGPAPAQQLVALRSFYLTDLNYDPDEVKTVCGNGYHMASLWELLDVSNLAYAYDHPDAHIKDDSGRGPPSHWYGWVRTGWSSSTSNTPGIANCSNWTSTESNDRGTIVRLGYDWSAGSTIVAPWDAAAFPCGSTGPVWCIED